jgi:hypothetical protein
MKDATPAAKTNLGQSIIHPMGPRIYRRYASTILGATQMDTYNHRLIQKMY